jgi:pyridoxamine 5'-phosphate oxidase
MSEIGGPVDDGSIGVREDPIALFDAWMEEAKKSEPSDPNAMAVASVDAHGHPNVRMVLLKEANANGFVFFTNYESAKGAEYLADPFAALCFHWKSIARQVRVRGPIAKVSEAESDAYFATRAKDSQIGAWASPQSRPMEGRFAFEKQVAKYAAKYAMTKAPRPPYWGGFRVTPLEIEFWRNRPFRLHDRLVYCRDAADAPWRTERLFP